MAELDGSSAVWYFAYGANMASSVLVKQRKIQPLKVVSNVLIKSHVLTFGLLGVPYNEPALASLSPRASQDTTTCSSSSVPPVHGVAFLLSTDDFTRVVISEGAGIAYKPVRLVAYSSDSIMEVITLVAKKPAAVPRYPSKRYLGLLVTGAREQNLPQPYQDYLARHPIFEPPNSVRYRVGKMLFDNIWLRVQLQIQSGIKTYRDGEGNVPAWFLVIFDILLWFMWAYHDYCHAFLWGRGDGL